MTRSSVLAFVFAATLGLCEAGSVLFRLSDATAFESLWVLIHGGVAYGLSAALVAAVVSRILGGWPSVRAAEPAVLATAVAVGTVAAILQFGELVGYRDPGLWWLLPGCAWLGATVGLLVGWGAARLRPSRLSATWCLLALAALLVIATSGLRGALAPVVAVERKSPESPNVLLISVDTLRSDRLGSYGRSPTLTPHLDALARQSVLFENALSPVALTGPSHTTMLTGLYPRKHGATANGVPISAGVETVAETLARVGYRTGAFVSAWPLVDDASRLASRFQKYDEDFARWSALPDVVFHLSVMRLVATAVEFVTGTRIELDERAGERTVARALDWISRQGEEPFLAFVHLYEPHAPYAPPLDYVRALDPDDPGRRESFQPWGLPPGALEAIVNDPRELRQIEALYDAEVAYTDALVGRLLDGLKAAGLAERTLVLFTADHGESLTEHGVYFDHDEYLYDHDVRVPLMIRFPDGSRAETRRSEQVRLVDLAPTILEVVGESPRASFDGTSLLPLLQGSGEGGERVAFGWVATGIEKSARARSYVRARGHKLIWTFDHREQESPAFEELYDLTADPGEVQNLFLTGPSPSPDLVHELRGLLSRYMGRGTSAPPTLDDEMRRRLRSLGYL